MKKPVCVLCLAIVLAIASAGTPGRAQNPGQNACSPADAACQCSFLCCGEERCDGSVCNQCVIDCVQRQQTADRRAASLRSRCQSLMTRGFKRL
jgi:hypothetical protein